jgi:hypothetical protein
VVGSTVFMMFVVLIFVGFEENYAIVSKREEGDQSSKIETQ